MARPRTSLDYGFLTVSLTLSLSPGREKLLAMAQALHLSPNQALAMKYYAINPPDRNESPYHVIVMLTLSLDS